MFRSVQLDYSQTVLIKKINQYQTLKNRAPISERGYCYGLAVLWLVKMHEQDIKWFYHSLRNIISKRPEDYDEIEFEKFLARIEWGQNPVNSGFNITQKHLPLLLDMTNIKTKSEVSFYNDVMMRIKRKEHPAMYLITSVDHAVAVFQCGNSYQVYDANYTSGFATVFYDEESAAKEIVSRLYLLSPITDGEFNLTINFILLNDLQHYDVFDFSETEDAPPEWSTSDIQEDNDTGWSYRCTIL